MSEKMYLSFSGIGHNDVIKQDLNGFVPMDVSTIDNEVANRLFYTPFNSSEPGTSLPNVANVVFKVLPIHIEDNTICVLDSCSSTEYSLNDLVDTSVSSLETYGPLIDLRSSDPIETYANQAVYTWLNKNICDIEFEVHGGLQVQLTADQVRSNVNAFVAGIDLDIDDKLMVYVVIKINDRLYDAWSSQHVVEPLTMYHVQGGHEPIVYSETHIENSLLRYAKEKGWAEILTRIGL